MDGWRAATVVFAAASVAFAAYGFAIVPRIEKDLRPVIDQAIATHVDHERERVDLKLELILAQLAALKEQIGRIKSIEPTETRR